MSEQNTSSQWFLDAAKETPRKIVSFGQCAELVAEIRSNDLEAKDAARVIHANMVYAQNGMADYLARELVAFAERITKQP